MHTKTLSTITVTVSPISQAIASGGGSHCGGDSGGNNCDSGGSGCASGSCCSVCGDSCGKQPPSPRIVRLQNVVSTTSRPRCYAYRDGDSSIYRVKSL